ncbi:MAG: bifunctional alpha,alpha-trehalose-phosphate synthase (UDP-forming)/trehalose-phosphatase [Bacteroidota bacterium]|nr:bifunctional alpha,alpha-trehalose-phosphate synthase (UDP-forming)/trehalose-phosphatase [Bacteroidota bacterium]
MSKTIIVSNRLPVNITQKGEQFISKPSAGGLATGLGSIYKEGDNVWIGWPGLSIKGQGDKDIVKEELAKDNMHPVFLSKKEIKEFYEGFSNGTLWPNFHYFNQYAFYEQKLWEAYKRVNQKFANEILLLAQPGDIIWIHDYQLLLLPDLIRTSLPKISIGFFQHIPFPSYEVFRLIPWRKEILNGMLGSDLIGFHTYDDMRHFLSSVSRIVGKSNNQGQVFMGKRSAIVDSFPMGIDYDKYAESAAAKETLQRESRYRNALGNQKLFLSIDRLDYSKGIPQRLLAFELFLERFPEYKEKTSILMIVVPSRDQVEKYKELKEEIDELVGRINGRFGRINWTPIHYFYRSFPLKALSAFYRMADVCLVTPMRDGMNLVCKEYIASRLDEKGVVILSEMAGASKELSDAILINPNDINELVSAMKRALNMPEVEQIKHMKIMQKSIRRYNIHHWVKIFMARLDEIKEKQRSMSTKNLDAEAMYNIKKAYEKSKNNLIFLDYDGTLTSFTDEPQKAKPAPELLEILEKLTINKKNRVVIISGRDRYTLEEWLGQLDVDFICEHGVWLKEKTEEWRMIERLTDDWKQEILPVLEFYVDRTPGSLIETKDYSLVWHYRKVETGLGELRTRELSSHLKYISTNMNLQVLEGDMVVEIKHAGVNKGKAALKWLQDFPADFIMAIGDDWTDEDTFKVMPDHAFTIKVGSNTSEAKFSVNSTKDVRRLLTDLES